MSLYTYTARAVKNVAVMDSIVGCIGGSPLPTMRAATMLHHSHSPSASLRDFINMMLDSRKLCLCMLLPSWLCSINLYCKYILLIS